MLSPLAGDINWMETIFFPVVFLDRKSPHSLGTLIEWKLDRSMLTEFLAIEESPLAGDINWMETWFEGSFDPDKL